MTSGPDMTTERQLVLDLWTEGKTVREIANQLGVTSQRIYQQLAKLNLPPNKPKVVAS